MTLLLKPGQHVDVVLPSGTLINIECAKDYTMLTRHDGRVFYHEILENKLWTEEDRNGTSLLIPCPPTTSS